MRQRDASSGPISLRGHLPIEEITAYHEESVDEESKRRIEHHLDSCPVCAELLAQYAGFGPTDDPQEQVEGRLAADRILSRVNFERRRRVFAIAASVALMVVGALMVLRRPSPRSEIPRFNIALGIRSPGREIEIPKDVPLFALRLAGEFVVAGERYEIMARNRDGKLVAKLENLVADRRGVVQANFETPNFPENIYGFTIRPEGPSADPLSIFEFTLRIRHPS